MDSFEDRLETSLSRDSSGRALGRGGNGREGGLPRGEMGIMTAAGGLAVAMAGETARARLRGGGRGLDCGIGGA